MVNKIKFSLLMGILFPIFINNSAIGQDESYVLDGFNYNAGVGLMGPRFNIGFGKDNSHYHEFLFQISLWSLETNENLLNKPTWGGYYLGYDWFLNAYSESKFKFHFGGGISTHPERSGKNTGQDLKGSYIVLDVHPGVRFYLNNQLSLNAWFGLPVYTVRGNSILTDLGRADKKVIIPGSIDLVYRF